MTDLVPAAQIETIVGARRHPTHHLGRAVSAEQTVYILHSHACKDSGLDLRECSYSLALDRGIDPAEWAEDVTVGLVVEGGTLVPLDFLPADVELVTRPGTAGECWRHDLNHREYVCTCDPPVQGDTGKEADDE